MFASTRRTSNYALACNVMILLDTHVLVWLGEANARLGAGTMEQINTAFHAGKTMMSAISFLEVRGPSS